VAAPEGRVNDVLSNRIEREYLYAERRVSYNAERGNWAMAERWAQYCSALYGAVETVCYPQERRADA
jgi:hypothetical protein